MISKHLQQRIARLQKAVAAGKVLDVWWDEGTVRVELRNSRIDFEESELGPILIELFKLPSGKI